jgi:hypothetical protein
MKTSINLKTRKMKNNYLKLGMMAAVMLSASIGFAQTDPLTDSADIKLNKGAGDGASVRVIDNKGTIKYLQTNNGITSITSTAPNNTTTTTWQLGGTLTSETNITTGDQDFKITLATPEITVGSVTTAATQGTFILDGVLQEFGNASDAGSIGMSGYTFLVRDEDTGATKKLLATDLITGGQDIIEIATDGQTLVAPAGLAAGTAIYKVSVYRNGNKLRGGTDYGVTAVDQITLIPNTSSANSWDTLAGDVIEVQWVN